MEKCGRKRCDRCEADRTEPSAEVMLAEIRNALLKGKQAYPQDYLMTDKPFTRKAIDLWEREFDTALANVDKLERLL